jgi:hypothetical protein
LKLTPLLAGQPVAFTSHFAQAHVPDAPDPLATHVAAPFSGTVGHVVPAPQVGNEHCALCMA